jgi:predicted Zn-dependent protease
MTIEAPDAVPLIGEPADRDAPLPSAASRGARRRRWWRLGRWTLLLSLIGLNAWWWWRDDRPVAEPDAIARLIKQHQEPRAEQALRHRLSRSPHDGEARIMLAQLLARRHDMLACARELHRVPSWWPDVGRWRLMEAGAFKECDRMREAESAWRAVVQDDPLHPVDPRLVTAAVRDLLELYAVEARRDDLIGLIWTSYDRTDDPDERARLLNMRLRSELERITPSVAAAKLERFLAADPQDTEARLGLARARLALNQADDARRLLEACLRERPEDPACWADYLGVLHTSGDLEGLRQAVARLPGALAQHPAVLKYRGRLLELDRKWPEADEVYRQLLRARGPDRETYYRLATIEDRLARHEAAQAHRRRWRAMSDARTELNEAYQDVLDLHPSGRDSPRFRAAVRRLAGICDALGWKRDADGWAQLVPAS